MQWQCGHGVGTWWPAYLKHAAAMCASWLSREAMPIHCTFPGGEHKGVLLLALMGLLQQRNVVSSRGDGH